MEFDIWDCATVIYDPQRLPSFDVLDVVLATRIVVVALLLRREALTTVGQIVKSSVPRRRS